MSPPTEPTMPSLYGWHCMKCGYSLMGALDEQLNGTCTECGHVHRGETLVGFRKWHQKSNKTFQLLLFVTPLFMLFGAAIPYAGFGIAALIGLMLVLGLPVVAISFGRRWKVQQRVLCAREVSMTEMLAMIAAYAAIGVILNLIAFIAGAAIQTVIVKVIIRT